MAYENLDPVLFMQAEIARLFRERHNISVAEFNEIDNRYHILEYIELCYEPFHLTGNEGILDEIDEYCGFISGGN